MPRWPSTTICRGAIEHFVDERDDNEYWWVSLRLAGTRLMLFTEHQPLTDPAADCEHGMEG